jgi:hypothetical protein
MPELSPLSVGVETFLSLFSDEIATDEIETKIWD